MYLAIFIEVFVCNWLKIWKIQTIGHPIIALHIKQNLEYSEIEKVNPQLWTQSTIVTLAPLVSSIVVFLCTHVSCFFFDRIFIIFMNICFKG